MDQEYRSFREFYPYYLSEHRNSVCRVLHFLGTSLAIGTLLAALLTQTWLLLLAVPVLGYAFAWIGHFFFEKNRPATFKYPLYSLIGDFAMFRDILIGRQRF